MKVERRQPTRRELASITSRRPVVRRAKPPAPRDRTGPEGAEPRGPEQSAGTRNTSERLPGSSGTAVPSDWS